MKNLRLVIGIVVILAIVCSPVLAISSSDLIAQYRGQSASTIPTVVPTTTPTTTPTPFILVPSLSVTSTPTGAFVYIDGSYEGLTPVRIYELSVGTHQLRVSRIGYEDYSTEIVIPACHRVWYYGTEAWVCSERQISIDVTLKKIESTQKPIIPAIEPTTIPTKPTPTPSPLTLDIYVDPFPATLIPSYYEYSKFAKPEPCIYGPPPGMSSEEYWEMLAKAYERIPSYPL